MEQTIIDQLSQEYQRLVKEKQVWTREVLKADIGETIDEANTAWFLLHAAENMFEGFCAAILIIGGVDLLKKIAGKDDDQGQTSNGVEKPLRTSE